MTASGKTVTSPPGGATLRHKRSDPLRRLTPTPHTADLAVMGRVVRLETDDRQILERMREMFARYPFPAKRPQDFVWRIISQSDVQMSSPWLRRTAFSGYGLRFAEFGQRNFIALDLEAREAIAFVAEGLINDEAGFTAPFLDSLFCMTAASLGLVSLHANCVERNGKAILILGACNSGKTTASYLASGEGFRFCADEAVCAEIIDGEVSVWSGFWPAAFRPETVEFVPELEPCTLKLSYRDFVFHHLPLWHRGDQPFEPVRPICCVFLERNSIGTLRFCSDSSPRPDLSGLKQGEAHARLKESLLIKDDDHFREQGAAVLQSLATLPTYRLSYGSDPGDAAKFLRRLLLKHERGGTNVSESR